MSAREKRRYLTLVYPGADLPDVILNLPTSNFLTPWCEGWLVVRKG
jgi:hypothetical protein